MESHPVTKMRDLMQEDVERGIRAGVDIGECDMVSKCTPLLRENQRPCCRRREKLDSAQISGRLRGGSCRPAGQRKQRTKLTNDGDWET